MVLSQQTRANRNVRLHEIMERSDCSPYENSGDAPYEINAHQWNIGDDLEDEEPVYDPDDEADLEDEEPVYVPDEEEEPDLPAIVAEEEGAILHCAFADDNATAEGVEDDYEGPSRAYYERCVKAYTDKQKQEEWREAEDNKLTLEYRLDRNTTPTRLGTLTETSLSTHSTWESWPPIYHCTMRRTTLQTTRTTTTSTH